MTQTEEFKPCSPYNIRILPHISIDENSVSEVISSFQTDGIIPDIIISEEGELIEGINALEAAKRLEQEKVVVQVRRNNKSHTARGLTLLSTSLLYTHPLNSSIYGEREDLTRLKQSISETGWIKPLVVTPDVDGKRYRVVDGNSCFKVCVELLITEVWVEVKHFTNELLELKALLFGNVAREKTIEQKVREGLLWEVIEREEAKFRQGKSGQGVGTTRDRVSALVGLGSGVNYEHAVSAVKALDETKDPTLRSQLKMALSKPRGVDAAYKLVKPLSETGDSDKRWTPKEYERVRIVAGEHLGSLATVRVVTGAFSAICHVDGTPEEKRYQIAFGQMETLPKEVLPPTSVKEELNRKQKEMGLGSRKQLFPEVARNEGSPALEQQPASITNLNTTGDVLVTEVAIALLKLTSKQLFEVMSKIEPDLTPPQLEAIWKALEKSLAHKAA